MTKQGAVTGPPIAMDRPAGQPADLPKEGNTRVVELPQGMPRHDKPREQISTPNSSQQKEQPARLVPPASPEASRPATPEAESPTVTAVSSDEAGGPAPARSIAPTRKVLAAGAGGGGIGVPLSIILAYHLDMPTEISVAYSGLLVAFLSFLAGYLVPAERS
jgi:hypothetical protein